MGLNKTYLPDLCTLEAIRLIEGYTTCLDSEVLGLAKANGYKHRDTFVKAMKRHYGIVRSKQKPVTQPEKETVYTPYPAFDLMPFSLPKSTRDEEDMGIVIADPHIDKITESYNIEVATARIDFLLKSTMTIINLHRPIRKIHVFFLGDVIQGENAFMGSKLGETSKGVYDQIYEDAVPLFSRFLLSLAQGVAEVDAHGVRGNHGRYAREAPDKTNWDRFFYKSLKDAMVNQKTVNVYPAKEFYQLINIRGFRFFIIHGDQAKGNSGVPVIALRRKMQEWYAHVGGFNYAYSGHFHTGAYDQVNSAADYTICPPLITGDSWALEKIGRASSPVQLAFGVHDEYGRTFNYQLRTDRKFMPRKYDEPEGVVTP